MPNDTTLTALFNHAKGQNPSNSDIPMSNTVFATFVEHLHKEHPTGSTNSADMVQYADGPLTLSSDKKTLSGELQVWRNQFRPTFEGPELAQDAFADVNGPLSVVLSISESGQVTYQRKINGKSIHSPFLLLAVYIQGIFVELSTVGVRSLSFTLGTY